jgi:hypothetical protein
MRERPKERVMTEFTRLTVIGSTRKADLVVPNDEAVSGLMPRLMELLDEPTGSVVRPLTLVRTTGEQLDVALTIADQQIFDGELLRFVRSDDAPPPPEVADVTDVLGESMRDRAGLWSTSSRELTGAVAIGVLSCAAGTQVPAGPAALVVGVLALSVAAAIVGRISMRWICIALTAAAIGLAGAVIWRFGVQLALSPSLRLSGVILGLSALGWICLGLGYGQGLRSRPAWLGGLVGVPASALPLIMVALGWQAEQAAAITAAVAVVVCGLLAPAGVSGVRTHRYGRSSGRGPSASPRRRLTHSQRRLSAAQLGHVRGGRSDCGNRRFVTERR